MNAIYNDLIQRIHKFKNPYHGFPAAQWSGAWYYDPGSCRDIFETAIRKANPGLIIEVGSFVGQSAIYMAGILRKMRLSDVAILCVDTWYAGFDHWKGAPEKITMHFGRPDLYYRFMANVIEHDCQNTIVPFASDSINAARVLLWLGIQADLVYVDASHEAGDVLRDMAAYWDILKPGGVMLVDDISNHFPGVVRDFERFIAELGIKPTEIAGEKAVLVKP